MFGFFRRKKKEKEDAAAAQAAAAEFAATEEAAAEPAGESAESGEPAGIPQVPDTQAPGTQGVARPLPEAGQAVAAETSGVGTAGDVTVAEPAAAPAEVSSALPQAGPNAMSTPRAEAPVAGAPHVPSA